jgi:hypothetical protein
MPSQNRPEFLTHAATYQPWRFQRPHEIPLRFVDGSYLICVGREVGLPHAVLTERFGQRFEEAMRDRDAASVLSVPERPGWVGLLLDAAYGGRRYWRRPLIQSATMAAASPSPLRRP